jgi:Leucine-rich repeat (LRR) protein
MNQSERKLYYQIKKLITDNDYDKIDEGIDLLVKSNNVSFFELLLENCFVSNGVIIASPGLTFSAPRQPKIDYALWNIIGFAPKNAKLNDTLNKNKIKKIKFLSYESYLHNFNHIQRFPLGITEFKNLNKLDCSDARLSELPSEISKNNKLTHLNLKNNRLQELPDAIGTLNNLKELRLENNELICLNPLIGNNIKLKTLTLSSNQLEFLPNEVGNLKNLQVLELEYNKLKEIPDTISNLKNLTVLTLHNNKLKALTPSIGEIAEFDELDLSYNKLKELPEAINKLINLKSLKLSNNSFKEFPNIKIENLKELNLSDNDLTVIPDKIRKLKGLKELILSGNRNLGVFESGITYLENLQLLEMGRSGNLKPKPRVLYLRGRADVEVFLRSIQYLYKLIERIRAKNITKNKKTSNNQNSQKAKIKNNKSSKPKIKVDENQVIFSSLSNYLNSTQIDTIDIGLDLIINLNSQEIYNHMLKNLKISSGQLSYIYSNGGFEFERYWQRDYCIFKLLTSAESDIVLPNKINILDLTELDYKFIEDRYPDFLIQFANLEDISLNCKGQKLKEDFHSLKKLRLIKLDDLKNLDDINFSSFVGLNKLKLERCKNSLFLNLSNQKNLTNLNIENCEINNIQIENNPMLESINFRNVNCKKLVIKNCPKLKYIKLYDSRLIPDFEFSRLNELKKLALFNSTFINFSDFISINNQIEILSIENNQSFEIPHNFGQLKKLKELKIISCNLSFLPDQIGDLENLEDLNLYENDLKNIPESLANLTNLKTIDLRCQSGRTKESNALNDLPLSLFKNTNLSEILVTWSSLLLRKYESKLATINLYEMSRKISNQ